MKQITTILAILVGFTMNGQWSYNSNNTGVQASGCTASGYNSTAMGATTASGYNSTAMGYNTTASGSYSTAIGDNSFATGTASTAIGSYTTASGYRSTAMGDGTSATDYASLTIGRYNSVNKTVTTGGNATSFDTDNAAFVIGNGTLWNATSDAFVVYFNGNATLSGDLTINSDERLKENIQPLGSTLNKLNQIEGWTYSLKKDEEHTPKIGVLAQEVQAVFPELVTEGGDGILSVNYQGLVPVLINAINEQEVKIAALEAQNAEIKELKEMVRLLALKQSKKSSTAAAN
ncbi:tail fiber domain-containing protein [Schleiferiaceae bacterium]|nr:tail fiber domain-containing protein [Schleiferiaceae bacterium]